MKFKSQAYTQASGSIGGITYSHNAGGLYTRARAVPVNSNTVLQQAVRGFMQQCSQAWTQQLTAAQREAWRVYAVNTPVTDRLGDQIQLSGIAMYIRCNVPRLQAGLARIDAGPQLFGQPNVGTVQVTGITAPSTAAVSFTAVSSSWRGAGGALMLWLSAPQSPAIEYFKGPYRFAGSVLGNATPPTSPQSIVGSYTYTAGQRVFWRLAASDTIGRLTGSFRGVVTVA